MSLVQITASFMCAGIVVEDGVVVAAAPILKYTIGWSKQRLMAYCANRRWQAEEVDDA